MVDGAGKLLGGTLIAVAQGSLFVLLGYTLHLHLGPLALLAVVGVDIRRGSGADGVGFSLAWRMDSTQGFHAVMSVLLLPMWLLSGAFFPAKDGFLHWIIMLNPLTYGEMVSFALMASPFLQLTRGGTAARRSVSDARIESAAITASPFAFARMNAPLQHRLGVQRGTPGRPVGARRIARHRLVDIGFELLCMTADTRVAGVADGGMGVVGLLHHRADEASELGDFASDERPAEIEVGQHPVERIFVLVIRRGGEQRPRGFGPIIGHRNAKRLLGREMMEKRAFGDARCGAQLVDCRRRIAVGANGFYRGVEQFLPRGGHGRDSKAAYGHDVIVPTSRYKVKRECGGAIPRRKISRS